MFKVHRSFTLSTGIKNSSIAVVNDGEFIVVVYHKTRVVEKRRDKVIISDGGWDTVSTRMVINQALSELGSDAYLYRKKGRTMLHYNGVNTDFQGIASIRLTRKEAAA